MIDKENDKYVEKVVYTDTGTVIRDCDEKLFSFMYIPLCINVLIDKIAYTKQRFCSIASYRISYKL